MNGATITCQWQEDGISYEIKQGCIPQYEMLPATTKALLPERWYCGYCTFSERPVVEEGYFGILTYAPVHGGITYAEFIDGKMTYGFDCNHAGDKTKPELQDLQWLKDECRRMATAIRIAAKHEFAYLRAVESKEQEQIAAEIETYHKKLAQLGMRFVLTDNLGAMVNSLFGKL